MITDNSTYKGVITEIHTGNRYQYGYIETENNERVPFCIEKREVRMQKQQGMMTKDPLFSPKDNVEFKIWQSEKNPNKKEAYDLLYIEDPAYQQFLDEAKVSKKLLGYLQTKNKKFFVKHISTGVLIPVIISPWETDLEEIYQARINKIVTFKLNMFEDTDKIQAVLTDRVYSDEFFKMIKLNKKKEVMQMNVTGRNKWGIFVATPDNETPGFILNPQTPEQEAYENFYDLQTGDTIYALFSNANLKKRFFFILVKPPETTSENTEESASEENSANTSDIPLENPLENSLENTSENTEESVPENVLNSDLSD
jgi:hypothetical protein